MLVDKGLRDGESEGVRRFYIQMHVKSGGAKSLNIQTNMKRVCIYSIYSLEP